MDIKKRLETFETLVNLNGAPGFEHDVRAFMKAELEKVSDEVVQDRLGSVLGKKVGNPNGPIVMVAGHMDEVGAMVVGFHKSGRIKMIPLGGVGGDVFLSQHMNIVTDNGLIPGVTASIPPHLTRGKDAPPKTLQFDELLLDIGADSPEHAKELGVKIGQQIVPRNNYVVTADGKKVISKAWDDRWGCGMALELMQEIKNEDLDCILYAGGTVQEEVGLRGAATATQMIKPDVFIALDASPVGDMLDPDHPRAWGELGKGFLLRFYDPNAIMHQGMKKFITQLADEDHIPYQYFVSFGGTDAAKAQTVESGVLVATIGMPARYIHSTTSMIHIDDLEAAKKILHKFVKWINNETVKELRDHV